MFPEFYPLFRMLIPFSFSLFPSVCHIGSAFRHFAASASLSVSLSHRLCFPPVCLIGSAFRHFVASASLSAILPHLLRFPSFCRIDSAFHHFAASASHFYRNNHVTVQASRKTDIFLLVLPGTLLAFFAVYGLPGRLPLWFPSLYAYLPAAMRHAVICGIAGVIFAIPYLLLAKLFMPEALSLRRRR